MGTRCPWPEQRAARSAPPENPLAKSEGHQAAGLAAYERMCANCHGADGRSRTPMAGKLPNRPTDLSHYLMESMKDGEIYWVVKHGIDKRMPAFGGQLSDEGLWQLVIYVRVLRDAQRVAERQQLGPYEWQLPPGFPYPKVPADNPMTKEKVELGRYLFYDKRLSLNQTAVVRHLPSAGVSIHRR